MRVMAGPHKGHLRLSITAADRLLTIHVQQASELKLRCCGEPHSVFVQVSLHPEEKILAKSKPIHCPDTSCLTLDEKFSIDLLPGELTQRLMMSLVPQKPTKRCEMIGCMSFGIRNLVGKRKPVSGDFYLMGEELGQRKHMPVQRGLKHRPRASAVAIKPRCIPQINRCLPQDRLTTVLLERGSRGYGFRVKGSCPVRVSHVKAGGAAHRLGLHPGDFIVKTDGRNVSRSSAESVARIVRHAQKQMELTVYCPHGLSRESALETSLDVSVGTQLDEAMLEEPDGASQASSYEETCGAKSGSVFEEVAQEDLMTSSVCDPDIDIVRTDDASESQFVDGQLSVDGLPFQPNNSPVSQLSDKLNSPVCHPDISIVSIDGAYKLNSPVCHPDISIIPSSSAYGLNSPVCDVDSSIIPTSGAHGLNSPVCDVDSSIIPTSGAHGLNSPVCDADCSIIPAGDVSDSQYVDARSYVDTPSSNPKNSLVSQLAHDSDSYLAHDRDSYLAHDRDSRHLAHDRDSYLAHDRDSRHGSPSGKDSRQLAVMMLLERERRFVQGMHQGLQCYTRPLRFWALSSKQHSQLFQNIEKLVSISEFHIAQLVEATTGDAVMGATGRVYLANLPVARQAYEAYGKGYTRATALLEQLRDHKLFHAYVSEIESTQPQLSVEDFIRWPLKHKIRLVESLAEILHLTPPGHHDYDSLQEVVQALRDSCANIYDYLTTRAKSQHRKRQRSSRVRKQLSKSTSASPGTVDDSELANLRTQHSIAPLC